MAVLSVYLPPFAPDYSGVCSSLFELNGLIVIHDASGCTGNYTGFDEPRWYGSQKMIYCSGLREMDAIMGNEDKFVERIKKAAEELHPDFLALVGSPVPMVIGTDFEGFSKELENVIGIPAFGFATNGTRYYNEGIFMAESALIWRYARSITPVKKRVNILGATPLDFSQENYRAMKETIQEAGYEIGANFSMELDMNQLEQAASAEVNIAVSQGGIKTAKYMKEKYQIPYIAGLPVGLKGTNAFFAQLEATLCGIQWHGGCTDFSPAQTLILGDAVWGESIKRALWYDCGEKADVGAIFGPCEQYKDHIELRDERAILECINKKQYQRIIADPLILDQVERDATEKIPLAHFAISSKFYMQHCHNIIGNAFCTFI